VVSIATTKYNATELGYYFEGVFQNLRAGVITIY